MSSRLRNATVIMGVPGLPGTGGAPADAFVVTGNGTNQTAALRTALEAARDSTTIHTVRILGEVLVDWQTTASIQLYEGCTLEGAGYGSVIRGNGATVTANGNYTLIAYNSNTTIRNLRVDGGGDTVVTGTLTSVSCAAVVGKGQDGTTAVDNVTHENLWVHNIKGIGTSVESFGLLSGYGETNIQARGIRVWNLTGFATGVHYGTGYPTSGVRGSTIQIADVIVWNCGAQGVSIYGADRVQITTVRTYSNKRGLNIEWCLEVDADHVVSHDNTEAGLRFLGYCAGRIAHYVGWGNAATAGTHPIEVFTTTDSSITRHAGRIDFIDPIQDRGAKTYDLVYSDGASVTAGSAYPDIRIHAADADRWSILHGAGVKHQPGLRFPALPLGEDVYTGLVDNWVDATQTAAYTGGGNEGANPVTFSAAAQFANIQTDLILRSNQRYLIRARFRMLEAAKLWWLYLADAGNVDRGEITSMQFATDDVNNWITFDRIVERYPADRKIRLMNRFAGTNSIVVDYITVTVLPGPSSSEIAGPVVTGSRGGNAALESLLTQLAALGVITNSTTA